MIEHYCILIFFSNDSYKNFTVRIDASGQVRIENLFVPLSSSFLVWMKYSLC